MFGWLMLLGRLVVICLTAHFSANINLRTKFQLKYRYDGLFQVISFRRNGPKACNAKYLRE
jgi:hypothetical protein